MVDYAMDVHKTIYPDKEVPAALKEKRLSVVENLKKLQGETEPILKIFEDPDVTRQIQQSRDSKQLLDFLMKGYNFKPEMIDTCYRFAKVQYECGNYFGASEYLYFHHQKGRELIIDLFLYQKQYLNAIQTTCPWMLRYLSTAVITNKSSRRNVMKDLIKVIQEESYTYRDPITSFIEDLYVNFDFDGAQSKLRDCENVLINDFFLVACLDDFIENSRMMIFETFCRIHQCISISMLADKLSMSPEEAERWIVNLIRNAKLDAKIDSQLGHVVMGTHTVSPYEALIERTKHLSMRSQILQLNVEKKKKAQDQPNWGDNDG